MIANGVKELGQPILAAAGFQPTSAECEDAYVLQGHTAKAKAAYQGFLTEKGSVASAASVVSFGDRQKEGKSTVKHSSCNLKVCRKARRGNECSKSGSEVAIQTLEPFAVLVHC